MKKFLLPLFTLIALSLFSLTGCKTDGDVKPHSKIDFVNEAGRACIYEIHNSNGVLVSIGNILGESSKIITLINGEYEFLIQTNPAPAEFQIKEKITFDSDCILTIKFNEKKDALIYTIVNK